MNLKIITIILIVLIAVSAFSTFVVLNPERGQKRFSDLGEAKEGKDFLVLKESLSLEEDASITEIKIALGLSENASPEEFRQVLIDNNLGGRLK
ncbi:MAG: hypothetical protein HOE11_04280 [Candidatus Diapherotrites archaeon]|jgi:hypothetical protein|nr:hypothetical protein [Candidatus Diapherotrites archaeon]